MSRSSLSAIFVNLWVATAAISLLVMVLFALIVWPREASTEEKLAKAQDRVDSRQLHKQGYRSHREQDLPRAIELYDAAIEKRPGFVRVFYLRGLARLALGDHQGAFEDFSITLDLAPNFPGAYNSRGVARYEQGDIEGALDDFEKSMKEPPAFPHPYVNRGLIRMELGQVEDALRDYDKALEINRLASWAFDSRGVLKYEQGDIEGAQADFEIAVALAEQQIREQRPNPPYSYYDCFRNRAALRKALGDSQGAAEDLARYQEIHDGHRAKP